MRELLLSWAIPAGAGVVATLITWGLSGDHATSYRKAKPWWPVSKAMTIVGACMCWPLCIAASVVLFLLVAVGNAPLAAFGAYRKMRSELRAMVKEWDAVNDEDPTQ